MDSSDVIFLRRHRAAVLKGEATPAHLQEWQIRALLYPCSFKVLTAWQKRVFRSLFCGENFHAVHSLFPRPVAKPAHLSPVEQTHKSLYKLLDNIQRPPSSRKASTPASTSCSRASPPSQNVPATSNPGTTEAGLSRFVGLKHTPAKRAASPNGSDRTPKIPRVTGLVTRDDFEKGL